MRHFAHAPPFVKLDAVVPLPQSEVRVFGRYALYDEIAAGGMATVHIGRLLGPVGFSRTVAIKRLHAQFAKDPEFVSMFLDEARLAARIRHPNVIGTLDVVALSGELFLVMEYVPGEPLARLWRTMRDGGRAIPFPIVSAVLGGALDGLHAAHEATNDRGEPLGIVHRDVSPHNILVGTDGIARVLDFGVAKASGRLQTTRDGQLKGKISYMAPEQVQGVVARTTDVYAAAVVLWELLTGRRLFFADNEARTLANVLYPRVVAPSVHSPGVPPLLDAVVLRALDPNPARRFQTARDMGRALQAALPPASVYDVADWVEQTAGDAVGARASRVASIERSTPADSDYRPLLGSEAPARPSGFGFRVPSANDQSLPISQPQLPGITSIPPAPVAASAAPAPPKRRRFGAFWLGLVLVVGGVSVMRMMRQPAPRGIPFQAVAAPTQTPLSPEAHALDPLSAPPSPEGTSAFSASPVSSTPAGDGASPPAYSAQHIARRPAPAPPAPRPAPDVEFDHVFDSRK